MKPGEKRKTAKLDDMLSSWTRDVMRDNAERERERANPPTPADIMAQCLVMSSKGYLPYCQETYARLAEYMAWSKIKTRRGLVLYGNCGTGKTRWLESFAPVKKVYTARRLVTLWQTSKPEYYEITNPSFYDRVPAGYYDLGIDDIGTEEKIVDFGTRVDVIRELMQERYALYMRRDARTFITTNLSPKELEARYGTRVVSRLYEMCTFIHFKGDDLRRTNKIAR